MGSALLGRQCFLWLALISATAVAQEVSKDDMWKLLQGQSNGVNTQFSIRLPTKGAYPDVTDRLKQQMALDSQKWTPPPMPAKPAAAVAGREEWPEANLKFEFGDGWQKTSGTQQQNVLRAYFNPSKELSLAISVMPLAQGDITSPADILKLLEIGSLNTVAHLKPIKEVGSSKQWGMAMSEGICTMPPDVKGWVVLGRFVHNGAAYSLMVMAHERDVARAEFSRFLPSMAWLDEARDMSVSPVKELRVAGAGFALACDAALMIASPAQLPCGVAATHLVQRCELTAFDVKGLDLPLRELATCLLETMAISKGGDYRIEETQWVGNPALVIRPKHALTLLNSTLEWRLDCVLRDGFLCVAMGFWPSGDGGFEQQHQALLAHTAFTTPCGPTCKLTSVENITYAGLLYNHIGLKAFDKGRFGVATKAFGRAVELNANDPILRVNLTNSLSEQGLTQRALEVIETASKAFPEHASTKRWHASLLAQTNHSAEAVALYEELFKAGLRDKAALSLWIKTLQALGDNSRAAEVARTVYQEDGQIQWRRILANCLWAAGKFEEARGHFRELAADLGDEADFAADHAAFLLETKDYQGVIALVAKWETLKEAAPTLLYSKGMAQIGLGWFKDAVFTLTQVSEALPGNQSVKEALARAQAMLGRGSHEGIRDDLTPVAIPLVLDERAAAALSDTRLDVDFPGEGWVVLKDVRVWQWQQGDDAKATRHQCIRILDASGVAAFATLFVPFQPNTERLTINEMAVTDKDGKQLATFRKEEMYIRDADSGVADGAKIVCLPVPTLAEGSLIEFKYTKSLLGTAERFPMVVGGVAETSALVYGAVAFTGEVDKIRLAQTERLTKVSGALWHAFEGVKLQRRRCSNFPPRHGSSDMLCWACDKRLTWEDEVKDYMNEIREGLADDDFAAGVVADLRLAGLSPQEICRSVVRWLNEKFQYQGLEFGRRARIPAKGAVTLARGFGDCKDLSVLVRGVLRKAGINARLALLNSSGALRQEIPSLDQFDHMVVYLPDLGGTILDATLRHFNTPEALSATAVGGQALVLEGESPRFIDLKEAVGVERFVNIEREVRIDAPSGEARFHETWLLSPALATALRYGFSTTPATEHLKSVQVMLRRKESRLEMKSFAIHDLTDPFKPLRIELDYTMPGAFQVDGGVLSGEVAGVFERWMFETEAEPERNLGGLIRSAEHCCIHCRIIPPEGFSWVAPAQAQHPVAAPGSFDSMIGWKAESDAIVMTGSLDLIPSEGDLNFYRGLQKANEEIFRLFAERIRFRTK